MGSHSLVGETASAGLSPFGAVEVSAVDIIHDSPSIVDQWHVCILSDCPFRLSVALHDGIRFLPPPSPAVPFLILAGSVPFREGDGVAVFSKRDTASGLGAASRPGTSVRPSGCSRTHPDPVPYRFGSCVLPSGSDSFSHVTELRPLRRFTLHSPCPIHPGGSIHRILHLSASSQGLHTPRLLGTHALVGSMGDESHGYFARFLAFHNPPCCFARRTHKFGILSLMSETIIS